MPDARHGKITEAKSWFAALSLIGALPFFACLSLEKKCVSKTIVFFMFWQAS
jgi:hypothetical protein